MNQPTPPSDGKTDTFFVPVDYHFDTVQMEADNSKRLGLCHGCLNKERAREKAGEEPQGMHYAAVVAPSLQTIPMDIPDPTALSGMRKQNVPVVLAIPSCVYCLTGVKPYRIQGA